jgi:hypothetical protein
MAKKAKKHTPPKELTRKQRSYGEREKRIQKFLLWGVAAVGIMIVGILVYGLVVEKIIKAREPVAIVGDVSITMAELEARTRFVQMQMQTELQADANRTPILGPTATGSRPDGHEYAVLSGVYPGEHPRLADPVIARERPGH